MELDEYERRVWESKRRRRFMTGPQCIVCKRYDGELEREVIGEEWFKHLRKANVILTHAIKHDRRWEVGVGPTYTAEAWCTMPFLLFDHESRCVGKDTFAGGSVEQDT